MKYGDRDMFLMMPLSVFLVFLIEFIPYTKKREKEKSSLIREGNIEYFCMWTERAKY